jgi:hypothetical protein
MRRPQLFPPTLAAILAFLTLVSAPRAAAQTQGPDYQRYITFHNDFDFPIYPVIQVPADICDGSDVTSDRRILVNGPGHNGLEKQETVTVLIPNEEQNVTVNGAAEVRRCWYQSGRIYTFPVDIGQFEAAMVALDKNNAAQTTRYDDPRHPRMSVTYFDGMRDDQPTAKPGDCFTGVAQNSFAADVPAQLAEYTFDSDNSMANNDPDTGTPMADIDVSNVDDVYLPVAASVENHGATGYMGSALSLDTFKQRLASFQATGWPVYSAYLDQYWQNNAFGSLLPAELGGAGNTASLHLPGGFNSIQNTLSLSASSMYTADGTTRNYLISGALNSDTQVRPYVDRWMSWVGGTPCNTLDQLDWPDNITPAFDKLDFCNRFQATAQAVWNHFLSDETDGFEQHQARFYSDCGLSTTGAPDTYPTNACIIQHIVGYNSAVLGGQLPGEVQALLRGVAYNPQDGTRQYQFDPFLTFAMPFTGQFNLNPYTRLIHITKDGVSAVAYSFSIDDKYGNFRDASSGIIVDAGGTTALENKQPFDPYQQYKLNWGYNRDVFSLVWLEPGVDLASIQPQLQALAEQNQNRPFLIRQADRLDVLGHAGGTNWKLTDPLVTQAQLQSLAQEESQKSRGQTHNYQDVIDYTFGSSSIVPNAPLNAAAPSAGEIGTLDFDAASKWPGGQAALYGFVSQQRADIPAVGNWVSASVCGVDVQLAGPGSQRLPLTFQNGAYAPCPIKLNDSFGQALVLSIMPAARSPIDTYTGAAVDVWGLPIGSTFSGDPQVTSNLSDGDMQNCRSNSTLADLCPNVTLSAVWAVDPLARDVVYMGLDPKNMPRVNINLPAAHPQPPNPDNPNWPPNASMATQLQSDGTVLVSWPAALVGSGIPLQYILYVKSGATYVPQTDCDQSMTACRLKLGAPASLYVIAINNAVNSRPQTPQLFGCYPSSSQCGTGAPTP